MKKLLLIIPMILLTISIFITSAAAYVSTDFPDYNRDRAIPILAPNFYVFNGYNSGNTSGSLAYDPHILRYYDVGEDTSIQNYYMYDFHMEVNTDYIENGDYWRILLFDPEYMWEGISMYYPEFFINTLDGDDFVYTSIFIPCDITLPSPITVGLKYSGINYDSSTGLQTDYGLDVPNIMDTEWCEFGNNGSSDGIYINLTKNLFRYNSNNAGDYYAGLWVKDLCITIDGNGNESFDTIDIAAKAYENINVSEDLLPDSMNIVQENPNVLGWLVDSLNAFMDARVFGDITLGAVFGIAFAVPIVLWFLKLIAGG